jgi:hypothetical protein
VQLLLHPIRYGEDEIGNQDWKSKKPSIVEAEVGHKHQNKDKDFKGKEAKENCIVLDGLEASASH